jgi:hypothetical protein
MHIVESPPLQENLPFCRSLPRREVIALDIKDLEQKLNDSLDDYAGNINSLFDSCGSHQITNSEAHALGKQVFYALNDFKKNIIEYLKQKP